MCGWWWMHVPPNVVVCPRCHTKVYRGIRKGFPDLFAIKPPHKLWLELKTERGQLEPEQREVLDMLAACGETVLFARPRDREHSTQPHRTPGGGIAMTTTIETSPLLQAALYYAALRMAVLATAYAVWRGVRLPQATARVSVAGQASAHAQRRRRCLDRRESDPSLVGDVATRERRHRPRRRSAWWTLRLTAEWHAEFIARGLPKTLTFNSGGGDGQPITCMRARLDCPWSALLRAGVRHPVRGYAVMPPSLHASGRPYRWVTS